MQGHGGADCAGVLMTRQRCPKAYVDGINGHLFGTKASLQTGKYRLLFDLEREFSARFNCPTVTGFQSRNEEGTDQMLSCAVTPQPHQDLGVIMMVMMILMKIPDTDV